MVVYKEGNLWQIPENQAGIRAVLPSADDESLVLTAMAAKIAQHSA